ncbi:MAG: tetratricopeptide repeat protein [Planctomycetes bacterium]|nr:tetratricopeptide repeat protein [Planctomycetota bacterium]
MIRVPLRLRPCERTQREAAAWFIPGDRPAAWLEEIAGWGVPTESLSLHLLPGSGSDPGPCGVLVTAPAGAVPSPSPRALPYGAIARRLHLPIDSRLDPELTDAEIQAILPGALLVFHPTAGLVGFEARDVLRVHDLIAPPEERAVSWDRADPGLAPSPGLRSVTFDTPMTMDLLRRESQDDIGTQPGSELPPAAGEPGRGIAARVGRWSLGMALRGVRSVTMAGVGAVAILRGLGAFLRRRLTSLGGTGGGRRPPRSPSTPDWLRRLKGWSDQRLSALAEALDAARHREINRLLRLLETDPDQGLRFALPLAGTGNLGRGATVPSGWLGMRSVDFNLSRLFAGGPTDPWGIPSQMYARLLQRYREIANRELGLGRHRRAAYIFAELLGDLTSAAAALEQGRHFREAATLYLERLKLPLKAAACLARAGLFLEAIRLYEEHQAFVEVGDLYTSIGRPEDAEKAYRKGVSILWQQSDFIGAAALLEEKVRAPDEALAVLAQGWPHSAQAGKCLKAGFHLLGKLGRHGDATRRVAALRMEEPPARLALPLAESLAEVAVTYPDRTVRERAADLNRVTVGRRLPSADPAESRRLTQTLTRLDPEDKVLARDAERYTRRWSDLSRLATVLRPPKRGPTLIRKFQLPQEVEWGAVQSRDAWFYAVGTREGHKAVGLRGRWDGIFQAVVWDVVLAGSVLLVPGSHPSQPTIAVPRIGRRLEMQLLPSQDCFREREQIGSPADLPKALYGIARDARGGTWVVCFDGNAAVLSHYDLEWSLKGSWVLIGGGSATEVEELLSTFAIVNPKEWKDDRSGLFPPDGSRAIQLLQRVALRRGRVFVAAGQHLLSPWQTDHQHVPHWTRLEAPIVHLVASAGDKGRFLVASHEEGATLLPAGIELGPRQIIGEGMSRPFPCVLRNESIVLVSGSEGKIYRLARDLDAASLAGVFEGPGSEPIGVVQAAAPGQFAVFTADGAVRLYGE